MHGHVHVTLPFQDTILGAMASDGTIELAIEPRKGGYWARIDGQGLSPAAVACAVARLEALLGGLPGHQYDVETARWRAHLHVPPAHVSPQMAHLLAAARDAPVTIRIGGSIGEACIRSEDPPRLAADVRRLTVGHGLAFDVRVDDTHAPQP